MSFDDFFILFILHRFNGERSIQAVYHLLRGKKSSQTIQDSLLFDLSKIFGTVPAIKMTMLNSVTHQLTNKGYIHENEKDHFKLTINAIQLISDGEKDGFFPSELNGYRYGKFARRLWSRLSLIIQTLSHIYNGDRSFIPITNNQFVHSSVKDFLLGKQINQIAEEIYHELFAVLKLFPVSERNAVVLRLTGVHRIGLTIAQLAQQYGMSLLEGHIMFETILHKMVAHIISSPKQYPLLHSLLEGPKDSPYGLTASSNITRNLLDRGLSIEDIAKQRSLKVNTIEDHLVEIALIDETFQIDKFVPADRVKLIRQAIMDTGTQRLRLIKDKLGDHITYFQIRLVLAKEGLKNRGHA